MNIAWQDGARRAAHAARGARVTPWSPIAVRVPRPRDVRGARARVHGCLWHTTGSGILVRRGGRIDSDASLSAAISYYVTPSHAFAHYVVGHRGEVVQIAADSEPAWQAKWTAEERRAYQAMHDGRPVDPTWATWWRRRWPRSMACCPPGIVAGTGVPDGRRARPNLVYVGVETLYHPGGLTDAQYTGCGRIGADLLGRHRLTVVPADFATWRADAWLGHEDVCPARRTDARGRPWDPGRQIDWKRLWGEVGRRLT